MSFLRIAATTLAFSVSTAQAQAFVVQCVTPAIVGGPSACALGYPGGTAMLSAAVVMSIVQAQDPGWLKAGAPTPTVPPPAPAKFNIGVVSAVINGTLVGYVPAGTKTVYVIFDGAVAAKQTVLPQPSGQWSMALPDAQADGKPHTAWVYVLTATGDIAYLDNASSSKPFAF